MADLIGQRLGQYEITAKLGSGGMATVYRARQSSVGRDVAIKVIEARLADNPEFVKRFEREARTIAALNHSHILKLFDYGQHGDQLYLVMELLQGGSLADRIHKGPLDGERTSRILDQVASALDYAHGKGIIHRDLKPQNVLFDEAGDAHLTDFGIAKALNETTALTGSGTTMGTPAYMSPEQCQGRAIDARSDIYALGIMLYEMLIGELPFKGDTPVSMIYMHIQEPPPSIRALRPDLPASIEQVIFRALAKDPAGRFQSAGDLAAAFKMALTGQAHPALATAPKRSTPPALPATDLTSPVAASYTPPTPQPLSELSGLSEPPAPRGRSRLLLTGALALIVVLGALVVFLATRPPEKPQPTPVSPTIVIQLPSQTSGPKVTPTPSMLHTPDLNATAAALAALKTATANATASFTLTPNLETRAAETFVARATQRALAAAKTPTPNEEQTLAANVGATDTVVAVASFTKTPMPTNTPTLTQTPTASNTPTATDTPTPAFTPTSTPISTVTANSQWTPVIDYFDGVQMVLVPPGCFTMGSDSEGFDDERPTARICFDKPFWLDQYEVANGQFDSLGGQAAVPSNWTGPNQPRESITWLEASDFCAKRGARLPTEAEWEYAARGPDNLIYPWGNRFVADNVVFVTNSGGHTSNEADKVGDVSWVGALYMSGNVQEWVNSAYRPYPYQADDGRESSSFSFVLRVVRGGSWASTRVYLRPANRDGVNRITRANTVGFRCARVY